MKYFSKKYLPIAIAIQVIFMTSCEPPVVKKAEPEVKPEPVIKIVDVTPTLELPIDRAITDNKGRQLEVTIIGKTESRITFKRKSDGKQYSLPIDSLSADDRNFLSMVKDRTPITKNDRQVSQVTLLRIANLEKEISKLDEKIDELETLIEEGKLSAKSPKRAGYVRDRATHEKRRLELELELRELKREANL